MKKLLANQKGYNLVIVLLVSTIFLVVGLSVMTMSLQGSLRTSIRETDIKATAEGKEIMDEVIAEMKSRLSLNSATDASNEKTFYGIDLRDFSPFNIGVFDNKIKNVLKSDVEDKFNSLQDPKVASLDIVVDPVVNLPFKNSFTRLADITLIVKNKKGEHESLIKRTLKRRVILSPTPSFLQYAVGSFAADSSLLTGLSLKGSPRINGNVFTNKLDVTEDADFYTNEQNPKLYKIKAPLPEINGDIYTTTTTLLTKKDPNLFYKGNEGNVPSFKNHSIFVDMNLDQTISDRESAFLGSVGSSVSSTLSYINDILGKITPTPLSSLLVSILLPDNKKEYYLPDLGTLISQTTSKTLSIKAPEGVTLSNITPNLMIKKLIVDGDLTLNSKNLLSITDGLYVKGKLIINNFNDVKISNVFATGGIDIVNSGGNLIIGCEPPSQLIPCTSQLVSEKTVSIKALSPVIIKAKSVIGGSLALNPSQTSISLLDDFIVKGNLDIYGIDEVTTTSDSVTEKDDAIFDSVMYVKGKSSITNVNIKGLNNESDKRLVLLSKGDLELFRINEFRNIDDIKPLKGYFYTDSNAELYGVGSIFHINGGLFAHNKLTINGIRGGASSQKQLITFSGSGDAKKNSQIGEEPRFQVDYDRNILFEKLDALPIVNSLQVIPDTTTIK
ncbi:hypothetical protein [Priestia koreensis]|uniref:hypothetical protein n=1 Tax=Priestia koreensis TaxID=284581 RepID=UPI00203E1961|nr:hypothetical protein [Priestia koreensis]MCM3002664.1 hypothetical protein [Priestia koreensis]